MTNQLLSLKKRELGVDYRFRDDLDLDPSNTCPIELIESGLIIRLGAIKVVDKDTRPELSFQYHVLSNPNNAEIDDDIVTLIGDMLVTFMIQRMENDNTNESREDNFIESDTE